MSEQKTEERQTAADIKKQIDEAKKAEKHKDDVKASALPLTGQLANEVNATESTPAQSANKPQLEPPAAKGVEVAKASQDAELQEWAKKKGISWTTESDVLAALRKSDQLFHEKQAREKRESATNGTPPAYQPPVYVPPTYQPPAPVQQMDRVIVANLARQYNMLPEDFERLMALNKDFYEASMARERANFQRELEAIKKDNEKNTVFRELSADPIFRRSDVGEEYHKVLEEMQASDPHSFDNPSAYKVAYDRALINMQRRNLEGRPLQEGVSPTPLPVSLPNTPPRPLGNGSGGGAQENENGIDPAAFAKLSLEEKRAMLSRVGLRPAY